MNIVACAERNYPFRHENCATANDEDAFALNFFAQSFVTPLFF